MSAATFGDTPSMCGVSNIHYSSIKTICISAHILTNLSSVISKYRKVIITAEQDDMVVRPQMHNFSKVKDEIWCSGCGQALLNYFPLISIQMNFIIIQPLKNSWSTG